jgi:hypothetical protein
VTVATFVVVLCFETVATNVVEMFRAVPLRVIPPAVPFLPAVLLDDGVPLVFAGAPVGRICVVSVPEMPERPRSLPLDLPIKTRDASAAKMKFAASRRKDTQFIVILTCTVKNVPGIFVDWGLCDAQHLTSGMEGFCNSIIIALNK